MKFLSKRNIVLCGMILAISALSTSSWSDTGTPTMVLYYHGEKRFVPQDAAEAKKLEKAVLDLLGTMRHIVLKVYPETEDELKQQGICLEISFKELTLIKNNADGKPILGVLRAIIPLKGRSVGIDTFEGNVTVLYIYQEEGQTASFGPFGTTANTNEIQKILQGMSLLPYRD